VRSFAAMSTETLTATLIGGPTLLIELGGLRILTDPTFDSPRSYEPRPGVHLTKTAGPAMSAEAVGAIDLVLLSHDHHMDNLDESGRALLERASTVLSTPSGAERLGSPARGLANWETVEIPRPDGGSLRVTGLPAQHGPDGSQHLVGEVIGFLLAGEDLPTVYVSGDNASLEVVRRVAERTGPVDVAVLFAGGAQMPYLGDAYLTLPSAQAPEAARLLGARTVLGIHCDSWAHFSDDRTSLERAFAGAGLGQLLAELPPGQPVEI
jgi:L-ascorbate metabolism protein UlaG (beta-lactamase superfamily)